MKHRKNYRRIAVLLGAALLMVAGWIIFSIISPAWSASSREEISDAPLADNTLWELPDTSLASTDTLDFSIELYDSVTPGVLGDTADLYRNSPGVLMFRGTSSRQVRDQGRLKGTPTQIVTQWVFSTAFDTVTTSFGRWGGGTGWTGQPLLVRWPDSMVTRFRRLPDSVYFGAAPQEVIFGSLCGKVYFLDPATGKPTRTPLDAGNTVKGTVSLDPTLNGNLYVGQGIPRNEPFGFRVFNLFSHTRQKFFSGLDPKAMRRWGAFDSSPMAVGKFLFWPAENGTLYKFLRTDSSLVLHSALRYRVKGKDAPGMESSMAVYHNYGYVGDNHGNILCINLNTLKPVWHFHNLDDTDGSPVIETENGVPFVYTGCEVDKQGRRGFSRFVKLNGLTGVPVWTQSVACRSLTYGGKNFNGGMLATPLLGSGDCSDLIISNFSQPDSSMNGHLIAFNKSTGKVVYRTVLDAYSWSSPVPFLNEKGEMFIFTGDVKGNVYLLSGRTGKILIKQHIGDNFESSPLVVDNGVIFGSRGRSIFRLAFE